MSTFRHHPDGLIYIDDKRFTLDEFLLLEPSYSLPEGFKRREYVQGERHSLYTNDDIQIGGDFPWTQGDGYIERNK